MALSARTRDARRRHLVDSAAGLIRDGGGAGFSMLQLADRAGVSPATPYNLLGSKSELLRLIVADEFSSFVARLGGLPPLAPLARLLQQGFAGFLKAWQHFLAVDLGAFEAADVGQRVHHVQQADAAAGSAGKRCGLGHGVVGGGAAVDGNEDMLVTHGGTSSCPVSGSCHCDRAAAV